MQRRGLLVLSLLLVAAVASARPPRVIKKPSYDTLTLTNLRATTYNADGTRALANYKIRMRTYLDCDVPSCSGGDISWNLKARCRPTGEGRCPGERATGPLFPHVVEDRPRISWDVDFELVWDTGVVCQFVGHDDFAYPFSGYLIAVAGTYACEDAGGAPTDSGDFHMGIELPVVDTYNYPTRR